MKQLVGIILLSLLSAVLSAQAKRADVKLGKPYEVYDTPIKQYFTFSNEVIAVKVRRNSLMIQRFDPKKLTLLNANEYEDFPKGYILEEVHQIGSRLFVFFSVWDGDNEQLFCREINTERAALAEAPGKLLIKVPNQKITEAFNDPIFLYTNYGVADKFDIYSSYDSTKILVQYRIKPEIKSDRVNNDVIGLFVFDKQLKPLWGQNVKMPYTEKKMNIYDYSVDSDGNAYILCTVYDDNTTDEKKGNSSSANYHVEMLQVAANTATIKSSKLEVSNKFLKSVELCEGPDKQITCSGFYSDGINTKNANGVITFKTDREGNIHHIKTYEIPLAIINQNSSDRVQKKNDRNESKDRADMPHLVCKNVQILPDGSQILVGEQFYKASYGNSVGSGSIHTTGATIQTGTSTIQTHVCDDILVTKINPNNELSWMRKLPKRQISNVGMCGLSFKYIYDKGGNNNYFVFVDGFENLNLNLETVPEKYVEGKEGYMRAYQVTGDGQVSKISIGDMENFKGIGIYQFANYRVLPLEDGKLIFEAYKKGKEDILIGVDLKGKQQ